MTSTQQKIISHLEQNGPISFSDFQDVIKDDDAFRSLKLLIQDKVVSRKNGKYDLRKEVSHA